MPAKPTSNFGKIMDFIRRGEYMTAAIAEHGLGRSPYKTWYEAGFAGLTGKRRTDYIDLTGSAWKGLLLGVAADPITYLPFGAIPKIAKATRIPGTVGKLARIAGRRWPTLQKVGTYARYAFTDSDALAKLTSGFDKSIDALRAGGVSDDIIRGIKATGTVADDVVAKFPALAGDFEFTTKVSKSIIEKFGLGGRTAALGARLNDEYRDMVKWFAVLREKNPKIANAVLDAFETAAPVMKIEGGGPVWAMSDEFYKAIKTIGLGDDEILDVMSRVTRPYMDASLIKGVKKTADNIRQIPDHWKMPEFTELMEAAMKKLDPEAMELFNRAKYVQGVLVDKALKKELLSAAVLDKFASQLGMAHLPHMPFYKKLLYIQGQVAKKDKACVADLLGMNRTTLDKLGLPADALRRVDDAADYNMVLERLKGKLDDVIGLRKTGITHNEINKLQSIRKRLMSHRSVAGKLTDIEKEAVKQFGTKGKGLYEMNLANIMYEEEMRLRTAFMYQRYVQNLTKNFAGTGMITKVDDVIDVAEDVIGDTDALLVRLSDAMATKNKKEVDIVYNELVKLGMIPGGLTGKAKSAAVDKLAKDAIVKKVFGKTRKVKSGPSRGKQIQSVLRADKDLTLVESDLLGEFFVHKHLADPFKRILKIHDGTSSEWRKFIQMYDKKLGMWKYWTLIPFGKFHTRNFISEMLLNNIAGMPLVSKHYGEAAELLYKVSKKDPDALREYYDLIRRGVIRTGFFATEVGAGKQIAKASFKELRSWPGVKQYTKGMEAVGGWAEDMPRIAMYKWAQGKGNKFMAKMGFAKHGDDVVKNATEMVRKFHPVYDKFTPLESEFMRRVFPFYSWSRFNLPLHAEMFVQNPSHYATIERTRHALTQLRGGQMPDDIDPEWIKEGYVIGWSKKPGKRTYIVLRGWLPHADLGELLAKRGMQDLVTRQLTPLKAAGEVFWGYDLFKKRSLPAYPGEKKTLLGAKVASRYAHILSPIRAFQEVNRFFFGSTDPYWDRVVYHLFGRSYTIDEKKAKRQLKYDMGKAIGELKFGIKRAKQNQDYGTMKKLEQQKIKLERAVKKL